jgi:hypothetical protein
MSPRRILSRSAFVSSEELVMDIRPIALLTWLFHVGVSEAGIQKLIQLRIQYTKTDARWDGMHLDNRLQFARWLYLTGKISG